MGDYQKIIVNAEVNCDRAELEAKIGELGLLESAYHCGGLIEDIKSSTYRAPHSSLVLVGQTKYGRGQEEFLDWLEPFVTDGSGPGEIWSIQISEYTPTPTFRSLHSMKPEDHE